MEISRDVWDGNDYLPEVFDAWTADPGATFQAAEVDGIVIGVQRLRPIARGVMFYEGLRVAESHRRQGVARTMLQAAIGEARSLGFERMRLYTENSDAGRLFTVEGFKLVADCVTWTALRVEGGDPPRLGSPSEAAGLAERLRQDPALAAYGGVNPDWNGTLDVDAALLEHLAEQGQVRVGAGGRGVALIRAGGRRRLPVTFMGGSGAALQDLLMALRFEADWMDMAAVRVLAPVNHPAAADLGEVGYHLAEDEGHAYVYGLEL
ncbi:MAG TPA: GNAT family N-acetyltransferase [Candidatus Dormibacteraeota bacterium]|nr:GNAT family N-acetyltransferase [Candidatus Dormibacteraeota bacterium]